MQTPGIELNEEQITSLEQLISELTPEDIDSYAFQDAVAPFLDYDQRKQTDQGVYLEDSQNLLKQSVRRIAHMAQEQSFRVAGDSFSDGIDVLVGLADPDLDSLQDADAIYLVQGCPKLLRALVSSSLTLS